MDKWYVFLSLKYSVTKKQLKSQIRLVKSIFMYVTET